LGKQHKRSRTQLEYKSVRSQSVSQSIRYKLSLKNTASSELLNGLTFIGAARRQAKSEDVYVNCVATPTELPQTGQEVVHVCLSELKEDSSGSCVRISVFFSDRQTME